ncbi:MAG: toll/interleukin-1 receptor domain-containing protein [Methylococcales bacterium]
MKYVEKFEVPLALAGLILCVAGLGYLSSEKLFAFQGLSNLVIGSVGAFLGVTLAIILLRVATRHNAPSVFVSYHHSNKDIAERIAMELKKISDHVWFDEFEIKAGDSIRNRIDEGLKDSDYFLIVLSDAARKSQWTEVELSKALKLGKPILPVKIDDTNIPESIRDIAFADLSKSFEAGMAHLKHALLKAAHNKPLHGTR